MVLSDEIGQLFWFGLAGVKLVEDMSDEMDLLGHNSLECLTIVDHTLFGTMFNLMVVLSEGLNTFLKTSLETLDEFSVEDFDLVA